MAVILKHTGYIAGLTVLCIHLLFIFSCAGHDPRNVPLELEQEAPLPQKTIYSDILNRLGRMTEIYGTKEVKVQSKAVIDDTGSEVTRLAEIPRDITEMLKSSLNSIGGRILYISYIPNHLSNDITLGLRTSVANIDIADLIITGGITQFDRGLETQGKNFDLSAEEDLKGRPIGVDFSTAQKSSVANITLDLNLLNRTTMAGIPRMQTTNSIRVKKAVSERELAFTLLGPTFGFKGSMKKIQGRHEAVRLLVQISVLQLVGRYLKLPYWNLLPNAEPDPVVIEALRDDYRKMTFSQRVTAVQKLLLLNGYVVAVTGDLDNQTKVALQKFDNRFEAQSQAVDEDLFLNLYFSVPIESPDQPQPGAQTTADLNEKDMEKKDETDDTSGNDTIPSVAAILKALAPAQIEQSAVTRGPGGRHKPKKQPSHRQLEIDLLIPFDLNQHTVTPAARPFLDRLGQALSADPLKGSLFEIQGHTCNMGRKDYNLWLSQKRAEAVKEYLVTHFGFQSNRLRAVGYGMQQPKYSNDTEENRAKNRRVTIVNTQRATQKYRQPLKLNVEANYIRSGREMKMENGISLTPDDNYALAFSSDQPCHVYAFQIDSKATVAQLFPNADYNGQANPIGPKEMVRLPADTREWFYLDDTRGAEELIVIAYPEPIEDPLAVAKSLAGQYEANLFPFAPKGKKADTRGPGGVRFQQASDDLLFVWRSQFFNEE